MASLHESAAYLSKRQSQGLLKKSLGNSRGFSISLTISPTVSHKVRFFRHRIITLCIIKWPMPSNYDRRASKNSQELEEAIDRWFEFVEAYNKESTVPLSYRLIPKSDQSFRTPGSPSGAFKLSKRELSDII